MDALANCTKNKIEPKRRQTWKISAQFHEFGLDSWFWFFSIMGFLNWRKIRCLIKRLHFLALLICDYISCWLRSCTIFVSFLISFLFLSLSCSLVSHFFHCNRSVYWWWCPSSSMVCGKRWTNYRRENRRFPPISCCFCVVLCFPLLKALP